MNASLLSLTVTVLLSSFSVVFANEKPVPPADSEKFERFPAVEPKDAEGTFKVLDGFQMQLIASEPLVTDPVAMVYDENGLAYVVEMNDYPYTDKTTHQAWKDNTTDKAIGKVRVLEDTDGDGKFDKSHIFAEGLSWPSGICCWKGGVYVTATPDIWYLKDTDGDHKADVREKVFTGFRKYNVQAVMNNPIWGLDNHIYIAGSSNGGEATPPGKTNEAVRLSRNDFRVNPITEKFEVVPGGARFGNSFDNWGHRFICNIRNPAQQIVFDTRHFARNPYAPMINPVFDVREPGDTLPVFRISPVEPWRDVRAKRWTQENKNTPRSELSGGGVFTSASGITIYRGSAYSHLYQGNAFVAEVANNVIHRQALKPNGVVFKAVRADADAEFVASTDTWFRPVNFVNAPDGTLHVLDMYREFIEHPWSIPEDILAKIDLESGRDRGRIYRLAPADFKVPAGPKLGKASTVELVAALENPNSWWRETAQRLLFERQDKAAVDPLRKMVYEGKTAPGRLHALWTLEGLGAVNEQDLIRLLDDVSVGVRENAVKLCEPRLAGSAALMDRIQGMVNDEDIRVRFQVAFALGGCVDDKRTTKNMVEVLKNDPHDKWIHAALTSATPELISGFLTWFIREENLVTPEESQPFLRQLTFILGAQNKLDNLYPALNIYQIVHYCQCHVREAFFCGMGDGMKQAGKNFRSTFPNTNSVGAKVMNSVLRGAVEVINTPETSAGKRAESIRFLAYDDFDNIKELLPKLLDPREPQEVQMAAVKALAGFPNAEVAKILLEPWRSYTPIVRDEVLKALFARKERLKPLLDAVEGGTVASAQISPTHRTVLLSHKDTGLRDRAAKLFGQNISASRQEAMSKYKGALSLKGDAANGLKIYEANCMVCHRAGDKGLDIGPNLETVRAWDAEKLLLNILDPNREVAPNYLSYDVELKDGSSVAGMIASETENSIILKRSGAAEETILRQNIAKVTSSGLSLMPEGIEANIKEQEMADLLAFLMGGSSTAEAAAPKAGN